MKVIHYRDIVPLRHPLTKESLLRFDWSLRHQMKPITKDLSLCSSLKVKVSIAYPLNSDQKGRFDWLEYNNIHMSQSASSPTLR